MSPSVAICADVGSTFTKVAAVSLPDGRLLGTASHRTTVESDVLHGLSAATRSLGGYPDAVTLVCSSAGGGLRLAVVGYEPLVTAQAGHRVGLSAGARVVHVAGGRLDREALARLRTARPDVVLLVGGTDGGDDAVLRHNAARLAAARLTARRTRIPIVVAGNIDARTDVVATLTAAGTPVVASDNVLPRIGVLNPGPARAAIREVFLRHVIGGKGLSRGPRFASLVRGATPDVVLTAVELLATTLDADLAVVDIGGATTDVYSVLAPVDSTIDDVAGVLWQSRTVEGDLGMRWNAPGVVAAALAERLLHNSSRSDRTTSAGAVPDVGGGADRLDELRHRAQARADDPALLPDSDDEWRTDIHIARLAATVALRRHARGDSGAANNAGRGSGRDLSRVGLLIGSGGVLRHAPSGHAHAVLAAVLADYAGGWKLPRAAAAVVDRDYLLAPAGLLAADYPEAATALLRHLASASE